MEDYGIIVGCDKNQEWLLPWWWENYHQHNTKPVAFFDFGMSEESQQFCKERGLYFLVEEKNTHQEDLELIPPEIHFTWRIIYGEETLKNSRSAWFKKPFAAINSPFSIGLWIDLDCHILRCLDPIFSHLQEDDEISMRYEHECSTVFDHLLQNSYFDEHLYNSGVILFRKNSRAIRDWVEVIKNSKEKFIGDEHAISRAIYQNLLPVKLLPEIYNDMRLMEDYPETYIVHYAGVHGKKLIKEKMGKKATQ